MQLQLRAMRERRWNHRLGVGTIHYAWSERRREDHDNCAHSDAIVEVDDVLVGHANAARGDGSADIFRLVGAVDPVLRVLATRVQIDRCLPGITIFGMHVHGYRPKDR
jgi:hypothetical protein